MNRKFSAALLALTLTTAPLFAQNEQVKVRVVHAVPQAPAVTVKVGNTSLFQDVAFKSVTPFKTMPQQDDQKVVLSLADGRQLQTTDELSFDDDDEQYTILVAPDPDGPNPKVVVLKSDAEQVDPDEVEVTLINAAPEHQSVKLMLDDDVEERGVDYSDIGDSDVDPGTYNLKIVDSKGTDQIIASSQVTLTGGTAVTVILTGANAVQIVNDASPAADLGAAATGAGMSTMGTGTTTGSATGRTTGSGTGMPTGSTSGMTTGTGSGSYNSNASGMSSQSTTSTMDM